MSSLVGRRTWIDGVLVVDAAAHGVPLNNLQAHDACWQRLEAEA